MKTNDPNFDLSNATVLSWAAVSSKIQDKYSIEDQLKLERDWVKRSGATLVDELVVRGFSRDYWTLADVVAAAAHDPNMEAFAKLQSHIRKRDFTVFLCFDADRFGRTESLILEVVGRITRDCKARIFTLFDGIWMDEETAPTIGLLKAHKAQQDITRLKDYRVTGMDNRARDGKSTSAILPIFHKRVRDDHGNETGVIVNEELRPLWTDVATLILRGVPWGSFEQVLFSEFGHGKGNRPYSRSSIRRLVLSFAFWGHAALNYVAKGDDDLRSVGPWVWDENVPVPPPTIVYRNRYPAVYSGEWAELGERVKQELWRRYSLRGKATAHHTFRFHGLLVCDECGYTMSMIRTGKTTKRTYIRCQTRFGSLHRGVLCSQSVNLRMETVQAYLHDQLQRKLDQQSSLLFDGLDDTNEVQRSIQDLERKIVQLQKRADTLIDEQSSAPDNQRATYRRKIADIASEIDRATELHDRLQANVAVRHEAYEAQRRFLSELEVNGIDWLWQQSDTVIHQKLCAALGHNQLVVRDGKIQGVIPASAYQVRSERRRNLT